VLVLNGAQQALHLAAQLLLDPGDRVWIEDPGYVERASRSSPLARGSSPSPSTTMDSTSRQEHGSRAMRGSHT
jgi:GntR family transcriptional regulator/MocR family aminotransferase